MASSKSMQEFIDMGLETYLSTRVQAQEEWMEKKSISSKNRYQIGKLFVIIFSVSIPFLVSLVDLHTNFKYVIGLVGVLIAAIEGYLNLYEFQSNWVNYRQTVESLKREKFYYATKSSVYKNDDSFHLFVERVETILTSEIKNWSEAALSKVKVKGED